MTRSALRRSSRGFGNWAGKPSPIAKEHLLNRRVSFAEFEALPPGFVSLRQFIGDHFQDPDRQTLKDIRVRRSKEALEAGQILTPAMLRMSKGMSQAQLAAKIGSSQPAIARLESGCERPSFDKLIKLQSALGVEFDELFKALSNVPIEG